MLESLKLVSEGKIKITPDVLVQGKQWSWAGVNAGREVLALAAVAHPGPAVGDAERGARAFHAHQRMAGPAEHRNDLP